MQGFYLIQFNVRSLCQETWKEGVAITVDAFYAWITEGYGFSSVPSFMAALALCIGGRRPCVLL